MATTPSRPCIDDPLERPTVETLRRQQTQLTHFTPFFLGKIFYPREQPFWVGDDVDGKTQLLIENPNSTRLTPPYRTRRMLAHEEE